MSWLVFDAEAVTLADSTGLEALEKLTKDLRRDEITLVVARLRTRMEEQFERSGLSKTIGPRTSLARSEPFSCHPYDVGRRASVHSQRRSH